MYTMCAVGIVSPQGEEHLLQNNRHQTPGRPAERERADLIRGCSKADGALRSLAVLLIS